MFGKDIDKYLEESDFDVEEYDKLSHQSLGNRRGSQTEFGTFKTKEQTYLQRVEQSRSNAMTYS